MQYMGGKFRIAKELTSHLPIDGRVVWEPFVGGANVTPHLARRAEFVVCSDAHPALIAMYQAVQAGWDPPKTLSEDEYRAAKSLPDSDPLKAFAGFGCSFGGKWFGGYARGGHDFCGAARRGLLKLDLTNVAFYCLNFNTYDQDTQPDLIYCDPPYEGTTGYSIPFDHDAFWARCQYWVGRGVDVYVSEYACPVPHELVWGRVRDRGLRSSKSLPTERLFRVLAPAQNVG